MAQIREQRRIMTSRRHLDAAHRAHRRFVLAVALMALGALAVPGHAAITTTGDVQPDPATTTPADNLYVGHSADGSMTVNGGSRVDCLDGFVGYSYSTAGGVTVSGAGSQFAMADRLYVGYDGSAELLIEQGGSVSAYCSVIAYGGNSLCRATVTGAGSTWTNRADLYLGIELAQGELLVASGGLVSNLMGIIGFGHSGRATVTVTGEGSAWMNDDIIVGWGGDGELIVTAGGVVSSAGSGLIGVDPCASGRATVVGPGSTWTNSGSLGLGFEGQGSLLVGNGAIVQVGQNLVFGVYGTGTRELKFLIGHHGAGRVDVSGNIRLDYPGYSTLVLTAEPSFTFAYGQSFDLMDWGGDLYGTFDEVQLAALPGGPTWDASQLYTDGVVRVVPEPATLGLLALGAAGLLRRRRS